MTNDELLANIRRDGARFAELVAELDDNRLTDPVLDDGWSVKDVLAHVTAWEQLCLGWVRTGVRTEGPFDETSINAFNQRLYEQHQDDRLDDVFAASQDALDSMLDLVENFDGELDEPPPWITDEFTGGTRPAVSGVTLGKVISANSDEHFREHIEQIERWQRGTG